MIKSSILFVEDLRTMKPLKETNGPHGTSMPYKAIDVAPITTMNIFAVIPKKGVGSVTVAQDNGSPKGTRRTGIKIRDTNGRVLNHVMTYHLSIVGLKETEKTIVIKYAMLDESRYGTSWFRKKHGHVAALRLNELRRSLT
jgi:hypothetical protein